MQGLKWHANGEHLIYPLGSSVVVKSIVTGALSFLAGHSSTVTAVALSKCGRYIASGQRTEMGQKVRCARRLPPAPAARRPALARAHARIHHACARARATHALRMRLARILTSSLFAFAVPDHRVGL